MHEEQPRLEPPADETKIIRYELDLESGKLSWSETLNALLGYLPSEPVQSHEWWAHHIHPDDAMALNEAMDMLQYPWVKEWTVSYRFETANHDYLQVHDRASVVRDDSGNATRIMGTIWPAQPQVNQ